MVVSAKRGGEIGDDGPCVGHLPAEALAHVERGRSRSVGVWTSSPTGVKLRNVAVSRDDIVAVFSRAAASYDAVGPRFFSYFARRLVAHVGVEPGDHVLDVGTGTGAVLVQAAIVARDKGRFVGIDLSEAMLERAADDIERCSLRHAELRVMDAERLEFRSATFDRAFCAFALLVLQEPARALAGFHRVLKPGGRLGLANAFGWFHQHDQRWHWEAATLQSFGVDDAVAAPRLGVAELEEMTRQAGFVDVDSVKDTCALVFRDPQEWWAWSWSHGYRRLLEAVEPTRLERLKGELFAGLERCREPDGRIHGSITAHLTRARKASSARPPERSMAAESTGRCSQTEPG